MDPSLDPTRSHTIWSGLIGGMFLAMAYFGCDQSQVQRYLSGRSLTESRLSLLFNAFLKVPMQFLILLTGVLVFVFFHFFTPPLLWNRAELARVEQAAPAGELRQVRDEFEAAHRDRRVAAEAFAVARHEGGDVGEAREGYLAAGRRVESAEAAAHRLAESVTGKPYNDTNYIFPTFVVSQLSGGLAGLIIAVIFAAAMSSLSGEFNSLATASLIDFYRRYLKKSASDRHYLAVSRVFTALSYFYGSILGVFGLAVLTPSATARGAFYGLLAGMTAVFLVSQLTDLAFLWYNVVGAMTVFVVGLLITTLAPGDRPAGAR
jgi:Na+/proline symporter